MAIGQILSVNSVDYTARVKVFATEGDYIVPGAILMQPSEYMFCSPTAGSRVRVVRDGNDWYISHVIRPITESMQEEAEKQGYVSGDFVMGSADSGMLAFYRGGMVSMMANELTGVMVSKTSNSTSMLGYNMYQDNAVYHSAIETKEGSAVLTEQAAGLAGLIRYDKEFDLRLGSMNISYDGLTTLDIDINNGEISVGGAAVNISMKTLTGSVVALSIDPLGNITATSPTGTIKVEGLRVGLNSDCVNPFDGVVTGRAICPYTRGFHTGGSNTVFVGE